MMEVVDREAVESKKEGHTTESTESTERKAPHLSDEQREWLNKVFIPNFRAELMRTLKAEDFFGSKAKRDKRAPKDGRANQHELSEEAAAETRNENKDAAEGLDGGQPGAVEDRATQRVPELEGENKRLRAALAETRVDRELVWAAASQHAINPAQVAHLLKERVRLDRDLDPIVVNANGDRAYDRYGRAVTVADAVRTFLEENPHLVRPSTELAGGGSGGTDATVRTLRVAAVTGGDLIEEALREGL